MLCPTCGSDQAKLLYRFPPSSLIPAARELVDEIRIYRCGACALVFSSVIGLPVERLAGLYSEDLFATNDYWQSISLDKIEASEDYPLYQQALERLPAPDGGSLLDIGCGLGIFLAAAQRRGWTVTGTELSDYAANYVREHLGCPVLMGEIEHLDLPDESFEVVTAWDVLEHVRDVRGVLSAAHRLLKPGGWLVVRTINEDALVVALSGLAYRLTGGRLVQLARRTHEIYHLTYFTTRTLDALLAQHGFTVEQRQMVDIPIHRLGLPRVLRPLVYGLFLVQALSGRQVEQIVLARKPPA